MLNYGILHWAGSNWRSLALAGVGIGAAWAISKSWRRSQELAGARAELVPIQTARDEAARTRQAMIYMSESK